MAGITWWRIPAAVFLPLPLLLVAVLSTPAPRPVRRRVLWFTEQVLGWEVRRPFQVLHFAVMVTAGSTLACLLPMLQAQQQLAAARDRGADANALVLMLTRKFRLERNFWMSLYTLSAWLVLHVMHSANRKKHQLRGQLLALQGRSVEAAGEVAFMGRGAQADNMRRMGSGAATAGAAAGAAGAGAGTDNKAVAAGSTAAGQSLEAAEPQGPLGQALGGLVAAAGAEDVMLAQPAEVRKKAD